MTETLAPAVFELPSLEGLPEGPWRYKWEECGGYDYMCVRSADNDIVVTLDPDNDSNERIAHVIASIPDMVREIERLREVERNCDTAISVIKSQDDEMKRLRALNAELVDLIEPIAAIPLWRDKYPDGPDVGLGTNDRPMGVFTIDQVRKARAILAKAKAGEEK
jgi:hypothetical protein